MMLKRCAGLGLSLIMTISGMNLVYAENMESVRNTDTDVSTSSAAVYGNKAVEAMAATEVKYQVEGGYIYFDENTGIITNCDDSVTKVVIPSEINGVSVTGIGEFAFKFCLNLTSVEIPRGVTSIGSYAFSDCNNLTSISIPSDITSIGDNAFDNCWSLTGITIPGSVTSIGDYAFDGCNSLKTAGPIGGGYDYEFGWTEKIPSYAFAGCGGLTSAEIPSSVTNIGDYAFCDCRALTGIEIPVGVTDIGEFAFKNCSSLTSITMPGSITGINSGLFSD